jgi:hypothetical protein
MQKHIKVTVPQGKLVQLNSHDVVLEIAPRGGGYDIEKVYNGSGAEISKGELVGSAVLDSRLYDHFYQELDEGQYFEV